MRRIKIGERYVGEGEPVFIVAEISCNHLQKKEVALELIEAAKKAGADAVKFQTYTPDTITLDVDNEYFRIKGTAWEGKTLYELYEEAYTPWEWFPDLKKKAEEEGLVFFSSPFDESAVDFLEELGVPAYKIASFEINHIPLLKKVARTGKPVIISTSVAEYSDIEFAINTIRHEGNNQIVVLKCTSGYPAPLEDMNLITLEDIKHKFDVLVGLSDHSLSNAPPALCVAFGASVIEKHILKDKKMGGHDVGHSLDPEEFSQMVEAVREAEKSPGDIMKKIPEAKKCIGKVTYELGEKGRELSFFKRSIVAARNIKEGEEFTKENIRVLRPGHGLHPKYYEELLGKSAKRDISKGDGLKKEDL